jgi:uncharacterized protein YebE (UPF0316 family)
MDALFNSHLFTWVLLPFLIFLSRICDVTIGTIRIIFVSRGNRFFASTLGFFEILIWLVAIGQIMKNLDNFMCYIAYAGGFAMGNFIGISLEEKLAMGILVVRVITRKDGTALFEAFKNEGFGVTGIDARGATGPVAIIYTVIKRSALPKVAELVKKFNPKAFYSIEDVRTVNEGVFPSGILKGGHLSYFRRYRRKE